MSAEPPPPSRQAWKARWIEPLDLPGTPPVRRPVYRLVGRFDLPAPPQSAHVHVTAHGLYELFVNGKRVGDDELRPGFTAYRKRLQVQTYDVAALLGAGSNVVGALLSDGWWRGQHGIWRTVDSYGTTVALLAEFHLRLESGEAAVFGTDGSWRWAPSHVLGADLIAGEVHDLRLYEPHWATATYDHADWASVRTCDHDYSVLVPQAGPPVRRIALLSPRQIKEIGPRRYVVDFGQNVNGWVRLLKLGPPGTKVKIVYGEWLDPRGDVTQDNVRAGAGGAKIGSELPFQTDEVISAGENVAFEPRHSTKGFQYVRLEGLPQAPDPGDISAVVVHSDLRRIGGFECSDDRLNRLHRAVEWSFRSNACEIPTDCPTRERSGWVGDWQIFVETAAYLFDVYDWSLKWLADLEADQLESGAVTNIVPDPRPDLPVWKETHGAAGWGDAAVHVPWELYRATGRTEVLARQFDSMCRWVAFAAGRAASGRHPSRQKARREPAPHERFIWDTGWHFGEWLEPGTDMGTLFARLATEDHGPLATAYLYRSAEELASICGILGHDEQASRYARLAESVREAWRLEFIDGAGHVFPRTQPNLVRALAFGLVPPQHRQRAVADLVSLVSQAGNHLATGFLSTPYLLPVLADNGKLGLAYRVLFQDDEPSWLYMTERSTTVWEDWGALKPDGTVVQSLNHYSKGAVASFLHRYVAGLRILEPGYRRIEIAPCPGGGLQWATTWHESPLGRIEVSWERKGGEYSLDVDVPEGSEAHVRLPDGCITSVEPGRHHLRWRDPGVSAGGKPHT